MPDAPMNITILGLSITSSWGNGHATTFRALLGALAGRGHRITFLERDVPWYRDNRDLANPPFCETILYNSLDELTSEHAARIRDADIVIIGSYVPDGPRVIDLVLPLTTGVTGFYDIDTPVTLDGLREGTIEYLRRDQVPLFDRYFSFAGGRVLETLEQEFGARKALPLYCSVDLDQYYPMEDGERELDLGYLGTYSDDRQPPLEELLITPARNLADRCFLVAGPQYPADIDWPENVRRQDHIPPAKHRRFYNSQRFTLNITRKSMRQMGWSPSVRLFEAAACGTPIISDWWEGLDEIFVPDKEILIARDRFDTERYLQEITDTQRQEIAANALQRVKTEHSAAARAAELEEWLRTALAERSPNRAVAS